MLRIPMLAAVVLVASLVSAEGHEVVITVEKPTVKVEPSTKKPFTGKRAAVDVAILLDTSNSMDGLINQAKSQIWTIVQQFAKAKKRGQTPLLRVALFEYGNTGLPANEGYIRQVVPLTDDLDKFSEALFGLSTSGGDEYCGQVIREAIVRLNWSKEPGSYQAIFIAGNEPFTQGSVDYRDACRRAIERGIVVNTIHCGSHDEGVNGKWQHGAALAEGEFFNIDQDRTVVHIKCPQDEVLLRLNTELNRTYLWYGSDEAKAGYAANQAEQDSNAASAGQSVAVERTMAKGSRVYRNRSRDLVEAVEADSKVLSSLEKSELPKEMQAMTDEQRTAHVQQFAKRRSELKKQINKLAAEREKFLVQEKKRRAETEGQATTLGDAMVSAIQKQLSVAGFENEPAAP